MARLYTGAIILADAFSGFSVRDKWILGSPSPLPTPLFGGEYMNT
jgi:hypothetical protein